MRKTFLLVAALLAAANLPGCASSQPTDRKTEVVGRAPHLRVVVVGSVRTKRGHGKLHINVDPERARVFIDDVFQGRGDVTRVVRAGRHQVRVELGSGATVVESVPVDAGQLTRVRLDLD
jgi:hypothetical protein